jgi:chemotaxis protein CheC
MNDVRSLRELELDALKETANIGAGHAATALSQMTNRTIMITVPEVHVRSLDTLPALLGPPEEVAAAVLMQVMGDLTGRAMVIMPEPSALVLCDLIFRRPVGTTQRFEPMEESGLKEVGNILVSAYLTALSDFLGLMLVPSVPSLAVEQTSGILTSAYLDFSHDRNFVICVETSFEVAGASEPMRGHFLLLPDTPSLRAIFDAIRVA